MRADYRLINRILVNETCDPPEKYNFTFFTKLTFARMFRLRKKNLFYCIL